MIYHSATDRRNTAANENFQIIKLIKFVFGNFSQILDNRQLSLSLFFSLCFRNDFILAITSLLCPLDNGRL